MTPHNLDCLHLPVCNRRLVEGVVENGVSGSSDMRINGGEIGQNGDAVGTVPPASSVPEA